MAEMGLSPGELRVLRMKAEGLSNKEIAGAVLSSPYTVRNQTSSIFRKLDVTNLVEALNRVGWIQVPAEGRDYVRCGYTARCGRPFGHRGQHGGYRRL